MNTETHSSAHYARRRRSRGDHRLIALKERVDAGRFGFIVIVDEVTKWGVFDKSAWQFMKHEILRAIESCRTWEIKEISN